MNKRAQVIHQIYFCQTLQHIDNLYGRPNFRKTTSEEHIYAKLETLYECP